MQRPDPIKRQTIVDVAATQFAEMPYHEVRLDHIAEVAGVGKGTLYIYFAGKEDLYETVINEGFSALLERIRAAAIEKPTETAWESLELAVCELVAWASRYPHVYQLMRAGPSTARTAAVLKRRGALTDLLEQILRRGAQSGELVDPHPELTAHFIPSMVRGVIRFGRGKVSPQTLSRHILAVIGQGIRKANP